MVKDNKPAETDFSSEPEKRLSTGYEIKELSKLDIISVLPEYHPAKKYMDERKIPEEYYHIFRWTPAFMEWTNELIPKKFSQSALKHDEGRIVIPFFNQDGIFHAYQGRALGEAQVRYISIELDETIPLIWGLDIVDTSEKVYVFEGVMVAIFIPNSLAICGGNFTGLKDIVYPSQTVICYDNEPRSTEAKKKIQKAIHEGFQVCIWPKSIEQKDINEMISSGLTSDTIRNIIDTNTYYGLKANVALTEWSKV